MPETQSLDEYHIFSGSPDHDPLWLELTDGLDAAYERVEQLAAKLPGRYFIFDPRTSVVIKRLDTSTAHF